MLCIIFLTLWSIVSADEIWTSCNGPDFTLPDQISGYSMRCLSQMLPRKWDDGDPEELISVSMTRLLPPDFDGKNIVFMLQGGPGGSGLSLLTSAPILFQVGLGVAVYLPDHRGTGLSSLIECPSGNVDQKCIRDWKGREDELKEYTITNAARDLKAQIEFAKQEFPAARISAYAVSYGTQWVDRLLSILEDNNMTLIDAVVMDGVVNAFANSASHSDLWANRALTNTLHYCDLDEDCLSHFDKQSAVEATRKLLKDINAGKQACVNTHFPFISMPIMQNLFFHMIQSANTYYVRSLIPALVFRMNRCSTSSDLPVLRHFFQSSPLLLTEPLEFKAPLLPNVKENGFVSRLSYKHDDNDDNDENNEVSGRAHLLLSDPEKTGDAPIARLEDNEEMQRISEENIHVPISDHPHRHPLPLAFSTLPLPTFSRFGTDIDSFSIPLKYLYSPLLNFHIIESERWLAPGEFEPSLNTLKSWKAHSLASPINTLDYFKLRAVWPRYDLDVHYGRVSEYPNVLMLNGELDPSTPIDQASVLAGSTAKHRKFVGIPLAGHVTTLVAEGGMACPLRITLTYLFEGVAQTSCVSWMPRSIDFGGNTGRVREVTQTYFGTENLWD